MPTRAQITAAVGRRFTELAQRAVADKTPAAGGGDDGPNGWSSSRAKAPPLIRQTEMQTKEKNMKSNVIDIDVHLHVRTCSAVLVSETGDRDAAEWLPLSQIEVEMNGATSASVTLPEWLAIEKGLV